ncbi:MAG: glucan biosynthesis protein G [Phenylobacterium sp.]|uniref:glucan biosynthesis protein n=1 Tax=Phenylobacterium sp. TaxID=1871053 RepID=UPI0027236B38|nr:glucan biosynthesis protein G [Phenylobacterium sp.]MDO8410033.1 glucan biosynthesis protein G [Phenylobacterium sp.]
MSPGTPNTPFGGLNRRDLMVAGAGLMLTAAAPKTFGFDDVKVLARDLAARPYARPDTTLPAPLTALTYDTYRQLGFHDTQGLWADQRLPFQAQFFHRGGGFREKVEVFEVADGVARPVAYDPAMFRYGAGPLSDLVTVNEPTLGFAGLRLLHPLNQNDKFDETAAFLGASYFRGVARGGVYGASARGLAIGAGEPEEEFPRFSAFWLVRPGRRDRSLTLYALMDSPSLAGAYRFVITPGAPTLTEVQAELHPRTEVRRAGFAPLTSMFLFDPQTARRFDDYRSRVHDSDGLAMANGAGERLWRPLSNPTSLQASGFADDGPKGFGLSQRADGFPAYQDLEARYDLRPSMWVEPLGDWGPGQVRLVELPTPDETEDNILAEWRSPTPLRPGQPHQVAYRLHWGAEPTPQPPLARARQWRESALESWHDTDPENAGWRRVLIDFDETGSDIAPEAQIDLGDVPVRHVVVKPNPALGGWRLTFEFRPGSTKAIEQRVRLVNARGVCSEVWVRRWLA